MASGGDFEGEGEAEVDEPIEIFEPLGWVGKGNGRAHGAHGFVIEEVEAAGLKDEELGQ